MSKTQRLPRLVQHPELIRRNENENHIYLRHLENAGYRGLGKPPLFSAGFYCVNGTVVTG